MKKLFSTILMLTLMVALPVQAANSDFKIKTINFDWFLTTNGDLYLMQREAVKVLSNVERTISDGLALTKKHALYTISAKPRKLLTKVKLYKSRVSNKPGIFYTIKTDNSLWEMDSKQKNQKKLATNVKTMIQDSRHYYDGEVYFNDVDLDERLTWPLIYNTFIIKKDNSLWGRGTNREGELGLGHKKRQNQFTRIMKNVSSMTITMPHRRTNKFLVIKTDKSLWSWTNGKKPQKLLSNIKKVKQVRFYGTKVYALNDENQLYDITGKKPMLYTTDVKSFALFEKPYLIKNDSSLWEMGKEPEEVLKDVKRFYCFGFQTFKALKTDNTLWGWGQNYEGRVGDDPDDIDNKPRQLFSDVSKVLTFCVVTTNGDLINHYQASDALYSPVVSDQKVKDVFETGNGYYVYYTKTNDNSLWRLELEKNLPTRYFTP